MVGVYNFACSLREVLAKHPFLPHGCELFSGSYFPSFLEGLSLRHIAGGRHYHCEVIDFPSFLEGLSLRQVFANGDKVYRWNFPSFLEGLSLRLNEPVREEVSLVDFPSFLEGLSLRRVALIGRHHMNHNFPSFLEGLSLRRSHCCRVGGE